GTVQNVRQLAAATLLLKRSNSAMESDVFTAWPFPVVAVNPNPNKAGHLYVCYADRGENSGDKADVFFVRSTDGGVNWTSGLMIPPRSQDPRIYCKSRGRVQLGTGRRTICVHDLV